MNNGIFIIRYKCRGDIFTLCLILNQRSFTLNHSQDSNTGIVQRPGMTTTKCEGDNNKISFRCSGEVYDYTFILSEAADYWAFKNLMASWSAKGITMVFQKVFEDEYIIQEMVHFNED